MYRLRDITSFLQLSLSLSDKMISTIIAASTFAGLAAAAPVANIFATAAQSVTTFGPFSTPLLLPLSRDLR